MILCSSAWETAFSLTFNRIEEVEEWILWNLFSDRPNRPSAFVFLLLLNNFDGHVFAFVPVNLTTKKTMENAAIRNTANPDLCKELNQGAIYAKSEQDVFLEKITLLV